MTKADDNKDTDKKQTPSGDAFTSDPRIRALVRFLARRAAEADYAKMLKAQNKPRQNPKGRTSS